MPLSPDFESSIIATATRWLTHLPASTSRDESLIENRHWGWLIVTDLHQGHLYCTPGADRIATFFRSAGKPFQGLPLVDAGYTDELTQEELALTCASHTGSAHHLALVQSILNKARYTEADLQCGPHLPLDQDMLATLEKQGQKPTRLHNNCSGKHAGMLLYCRKAGIDAGDYLNPAHPLQQHILRGIQYWGDIQDVPLGVDGCGAPVFYLPLPVMARLFAQLGTVDAFQPLREAMVAYPAVVGGEGRVDTVLMQVSNGKLLAKVGADGVICVSRIGTSQGLALKIADGSNEVRNIAIVEILSRIGWLEDTAAQDARLTPYRNAQRMNAQNKVIGDYKIYLDPEQALV